MFAAYIFHAPPASASDPEPDPERISIRWATDSGSGSVFEMRIWIRIQVFNFA